MPNLPEFVSDSQIDESNASQSIDEQTTESETKAVDYESASQVAKAVETTTDIGSATYQIPASRQDHQTTSLIFGVLGIMLNFGCGCLFPIWFLMNGFGLYLAFRSKGNLRTPAIITNVIAIAISSFWILVWLMS